MVGEPHISPCEQGRGLKHGREPGLPFSLSFDSSCHIEASGSHFIMVQILSQELHELPDKASW